MSFPFCPVVNNSLFSTAVAASIFLHSAFYVLSHPIPVRSLPSGEAEEEAATLQSRSAVPSSPLLSSPLPSVRSFQTLLRISLPPASPRSLLGGEGRKRRDDGAERKCLLCKRWSEKQNGKEKRATPSGGRAANNQRTARDKREKRASSGRTNQPSFFPLAKCRL